MSWAERLTGISPTITQFLFAPMLGRIASIGADITRHRRADRGGSGPFHVEAILDTRSSSPTTWARRRTPGARAGGVLHQKERSQPHPSRWRGAATSI